MSRVKKSREAYDATVKRAERLIATAEKREKKHIENLAQLEVRRAEEARIADELRRKLAGTKTAEEDLRRQISEIESKCETEFRRAEELSASLSAGNQKHEDELKDWAKKLAEYESAKSSEVKCCVWKVSGSEYGFALPSESSALAEYCLLGVALA
ncbi:hypothetical protein AXG93_593s1020 [Marchantia polymorpha subsp. ruderalis]|uniref:Uncharacterized protein n=1 Tax=Marchantia polymorpha subsp. ruderalis TaxID=1480154 RepID=A0A176WRM8_MARPO|nr:hypothetical protein AXG93_593s1020 [Marchantia polymorpha subsp. ruderalis]